MAVRSSALDEDGPGSSFAGQHDTFLNIRGRDAVVDAVLRCVRSASSAEALSYRKEHALQSDDVKIAVLVQQLVPSDVSAVVFSCNPVTGAHDEVMITSNWGLGESVVGGMVNPDTFVVAKDASALVDATARLQLEGEIMKTVDRQLGAVARPSRVHFVTLLPKTRSGKLLRRAIAAVCEQRDPGDLTTMDDPSALQQIAALTAAPAVPVPGS